MLTAIDRDDGPGDAARAIADQERSQGADVLNVDKLALWRSGGFRSQHFIEMRDPTARPGADGAGRNCVGANAFWSELHGCPRVCNGPRFRAPPSPGRSEREPGRLLDDFGKEAVAAIADLCHHLRLWLKPISGERRGDVTMPRRRLSVMVVMMVTVVMVIAMVMSSRRSDDAPDATHDAASYAARCAADDSANRTRRTSALCCASFTAPYNALSLRR